MQRIKLEVEKVREFRNPGEQSDTQWRQEERESSSEG